MTVSKLLTSAPAVEKQLTKTITKDKAAQYWVNTLEFITINAWKTQSWYFIGSFNAKIRLENSSKIISFSDINTKINDITQEIIKDAGLVM